MTEKPTPKYIDPMVDFGFKKIFKESGKKQLLIRPLNEIFGLDIVDINIRESEQKYFLERALFYTAVPIAKSMPKQPAKSKKKKDPAKKKRIRWNYNYPPVFLMGLLNFDLRHFNPNLKEPEQFIHLFSLRDEHTGELMTDRLRFAFLEVARFNKTMEQCQTFEERFLFIMKNLPTFVETPELWADDEPYFQELLQEAEFAKMTDRQQEQYLARMMHEWDYQNSIDFAMEKGEAKGEAKKAIEIARKMLAEGLPFDVVARCSGLTEEQVRGL